MHMTIRVAIAGASGYAGGEVLRLLAAHPEFAIGTLTANASAGEPLGRHHPHLRSLADRVLEPTTPEALNGHDVVVIALPHATSGPLAAQLGDALVVDCGADHRLVDADDWLAFYGTPHAGTWPYALPELMLAGGARQREKLGGARRLAVPGCNVMAVTLGIQPGVAAGLIDETDLVAVLAVGYSGAGKALKAHLTAAEGLGSAAPYAVGGVHRHIPEIEQNLRAAGGAGPRVSFTPVLVPMARGVLATTTARLAPGADPAAIRAAWERAYADEPFVHLLPEGQWPTTAATAGANVALVQVAYDERAGRVVTVAALDNLTKGTAGSAVQSMNLALGFPETRGLTADGVAP
jgi:N-acetyl-gamma-glutamyl-phosphate reductase